MDAPMPDGNKCPQCGTPLPSGALAGLCPACRLKIGAAEDTITDGPRKAFTPPSLAELASLFPQLDIFGNGIPWLIMATSTLLVFAGVLALLRRWPQWRWLLFGGVFLAASLGAFMLLALIRA